MKRAARGSGHTTVRPCDLRALRLSRIDNSPGGLHFLIITCEVETMVLPRKADYPHVARPEIWALLLDADGRWIRMPAVSLSALRIVTAYGVMNRS